MSVARHRRPSRPRPVGANIATVVVLALVVAALLIGAVGGPTLGGPRLGGTEGAGAAEGRPTQPVRSVEHHDDDHDGLRTTDSLRRELTQVSARIRSAKRALRRCEARSGRAERRCERKARARVRTLRAERERLRRQLDRVTNPPATPRRPGTPTTPGTPAPAEGSGYSLLWTDRPQARWRCTTTLTYRVNTASAPANAVADTRAAFDLVGSINGYRYVYAGSTTATGPVDGTDVVVSWTNGDVDNGGGAIAVGGQRLSWGGSLSRETLSHGYVRVEAGARLSAGMGTEGRTSSALGRVLVHEIGHVMGLGHVQDSRQIMYGVIGGQTTAAAAGDRAGFVRQGRAAACA